MQKRFFKSVSAVLTLTLLFSMLTCAPISVSAMETVSQAVAATPDEPFGERYNGRYTLESSTYQLDSDFEARGYLYVPSGVTAEIDLNGHTITRTLTDEHETGFVIKNEGALTVTDSSGNDSGMITGGYAERGGAVNNFGTLNINGGTFRYNKATYEGGAIMNNEGATLNVTGGVFKNNEVLTYGGGAILNKGTATVSGCTISGNITAMNGAGIWSGDGAVLNLEGGNIVGNKPGADQNGGGLYIKENSIIRVSGSPYVMNNIKNNLFLDGSAVITFSNTALGANATLDIAGTDLSSGRAVTSGFSGINQGRESAFTFAYGATGAQLVNGELTVDTSADVTVNTWTELKNAINANNSSIALGQNITSSGGDSDMITVDDKEVTIDLRGHKMDRKRSSKATDGHAIWVTGSSKLVVKDSFGGGTVTGGYANNGGAISCDNYTTVELYNVNFTNNKANLGGAIISRNRLYIYGCVFKNNSADSNGGAVYVASGLPEISGCLMDNNSAGDTGAVFVHENGGALYAYRSAFTNNKSTSYGGGAIAAYNDLTLNGCIVTGNTANTKGGGVWSDKKLTLRDTVLDNNKASQEGGAVYSKSHPVEMTGCTVRNNTANEGGGLNVAKDHSSIFNVSDTVFSGNTAQSSGGGAIATYAQGTIGGCTFNGNTAQTSGGAVWTKTVLTMNNCNINNNVARNNSGGGVYVLSCLNLNGCYVSLNSCKEWGGGIYLPDNSGATLNMTDSTIEYNTCGTNGGGVHISGEAMMNVSGRIVVKDNYLNTSGSSTANDVRITDAAYVYKAGELTADSLIYISPKLYNHALAVNVTEADMDCFIFDDPAAESTWHKFCIENQMYAYENYDGSNYEKTVGQPIKGGALDGATVRFRPHGSRNAVTINKDGDGGSALHLYFLGHSSRFYLKKVTDTNENFNNYTTERNIGDAYIIYNYHKERDNSPNTSKMVAAEDGDNGASVHLEDSFSSGDSDRNRFYWYFIPQPDGSYYIQNARYLKHYWSLDDLTNVTDNDNELEAKTAAVNWDMEVISTDKYTSGGAYQGETVPIKKAKIFDSYNVTNYGGANAMNWMTNLPGEVNLGDINLPGTHDAATLNVESYDSRHCQQLYIDDMLNVGVRHLDLRIHAEERTGYADDFILVHDTDECHTRNDSYLTFATVLKWCTAFLDKNPGETLVFQFNEDNSNHSAGLMYKYFKLLATQPNSRIYIGSGAPRLEQARGKIYIISRLAQDDAQWGVENDPERPEGASYYSEMLYAAYPWESNNYALKWAFDASGYKDFGGQDTIFDDDDPDHLVYGGTNSGTELWVLDNWHNNVDHKRDILKIGLFEHETQTVSMIRDRVKETNSHDALCLFYTSDSGRYTDAGTKSNYDIAKEIQSWFFDQPWYTDNIFTGMLCQNFIDGYSAYRSWSSNYKANGGNWKYTDDHTRVWKGPGDFDYYTDYGTLLDPVEMLVTRNNPIAGVPLGSTVKATFAQYKYEPVLALAKFEIEEIAEITGNRFTGHSLTLEGDIGINYFIDITDEEVANGATVDFIWEVNDTVKTHSVTLTPANKINNRYRASVPVAVAEMTYDITATLSLAGTQVETNTYSVKRYGDTILSEKYRFDFLENDHTEAEYEKLSNLIKTMLDYGTKAQIQFGRNTDYPANEGVGYRMQKVTANMLTSTASDMDSGLDNYGLEYAGTTIVYQTKTSMRHYYKITNQSDFDAVKDNIYFNGKKAGYTNKDGKIYFELQDIAAADLDTPYTLKIGESNYNYSVLDYARECLSAANAPYNTKQLVSATYWYNQAANAYFG